MSEIRSVREEAGKDLPQITAPSNNRMIIAFPFSAVRISQPDETVSGLAALLVELAEFVAKGAKNPEADRIADRARGIARQIARDSDS